MPGLFAVLFSLLACGSEEQPQQAEPCTVAQEDDGGVIISCPDGTQVTIPGPVESEASSCSVQDS